MIDACDFFLLFWSNHAKGWDWVHREVRYDLSRMSGDDLSPPKTHPLLIEGPSGPETVEGTRASAFEQPLALPYGAPGPFAGAIHRAKSRRVQKLADHFSTIGIHVESGAAYETYDALALAQANRSRLESTDSGTTSDAP
jgi:hypothetical protein